MRRFKVFFSIYLLTRDISIEVSDGVEDIHDLHGLLTAAVRPLE
jgi:hypothetical protein